MNETVTALLRYPCPIGGCSRRFADERMRSDHLRSAHGLDAGSVIYRCRREGCSQTFDTKAKRDGHEDVGHRKGAPALLGCPSKCGKTFITELQRDAHVRVAHPVVGAAAVEPGSTDPAPEVAEAERASDRAPAATPTPITPEPGPPAEKETPMDSEELCHCGRPARHRGVHRGVKATRGVRGGYEPGPKTASELAPPPKGPGAGAKKSEPKVRRRVPTRAVSNGHVVVLTPEQAATLAGLIRDHGLSTTNLFELTPADEELLRLHSILTGKIS